MARHSPAVSTHYPLLARLPDTRWLFPSLILSSVSITLSLLLNFVGTAISAGWPAVPPGLFAIIFVAICGNIYINAQLPLKRHMSNNRSPILSNLGTVLGGMGKLHVLESHRILMPNQYPCERTVRRACSERNPTSELTATQALLGLYGISTGASPSMGMLWMCIPRLTVCLYRWLAIRLDSLGGIFAGIVAAWLVYGGDFSAGTVGFTLTLISSFSGFLVIWIRLVNEAEVQANRFGVLFNLKMTLIVP